MGIPLALSQNLPKIAFEKWTLKNGLQVILHEDYSVPMVAVNIWYHVGSKNEKIGRTGFAHLFEHLMFQGSEHQPDKYMPPLQKIGGSVNGSTSEDRTNYWENVPSNYLEFALWMESDRMGFLLPAMTQKKLDNQRDVVKNERRQNYEDRPYSKAWILLSELLFPAGHPYSWPVIGSQEDLSRTSKEDVEEFFRTYYTPNNASLCIAGDFDPRTAKTLVEKYFADIPPGPPVDRIETWIPELNGEKRMSAEDRISLPRLILAWHTPPYYAPDDAELDFLGSVLSQGKTSRLYQALVYEKQIAQNVSAYQSSMELGSNFQIVVTAKSGHSLEEIEKAIDQELETIQKAGVSDTELTRVKNNYETHFIWQLENIGGFGGKADRLNEYNIYLDNPDRFQWDLDRHLAITPAGIQKVAQKYLNQNRIVLYILPQGELKAVPSQIVRTMEPKPSAEPVFSPPGVEKSKLSNGMEVLLVEEHKLPLINMSLVIKSGWTADPQNRPSAASLTSELLDEGTSTRNALQIDQEAKMLGATLTTGSSFDGSFVDLAVLKRQLDKGLALLSDVVLHPTFPIEELERQRQMYLGRIEQEAMEPSTSGLKLFYRMLYGPNHPYAQPFTGSGTTESIKAVQRNDLKTYYETFYHPNNSAVVVVGDISLKEILPKLEEAFKAWKPQNIPVNVVPSIKPLTATKIYLVDKPGAAQSAVFAGNLGIERRSPDYNAVQVLNSALGGKFTSRINLNLREDKGYSYGARSSFYTNRSSGPFVVSAPVHTQFTKETVAEIEKELRGICGEKPITSRELQDSKNYLIQLFTQRFTSSGWIADQVADQVVFGLPDDSFRLYVPGIQSVQIQSSTAVAKKYIHPEALLYVIVGDAAKIEPGLRELKIGEMGYLDSDGNPVSR